jgi:hypothetical protein
MKNALTFVLGAAIAASPAWALNNRSWVFSFGSDSNDCSAMFPCRTFQHALAMTNPGGEIDVLNPGDYGQVQITKSITIDGGNMGYIQLTALQQTGILVTAPGSKVTIRNLSINATPQASVAGIFWIAGKYLAIENVIVQNLAFGIQTALPVSADSGVSRLLVKDSTILNTNWGIDIESATFGKPSNIDATIDHVMVDNTYAVGLLIWGGVTHVSRSTFTHAGQAAIEADLATVSVEDSSMLKSANGISAQGANCVVRIAGNNIFDNSIGLGTSGGAQIISFGTNRVLGNLFSESPTSTAALK